jgi:hypothetical protein
LEPSEVWPKALVRLRKYYAATFDLEVVSDFCKVTTSTTMEWLADKQPPVGERLIRLVYFLRASGHEAPELDALPPFNRMVSEVFAFSVVGPDEVLDILNVKTRQTALQIMRGQPPMHPRLSLEELNELYSVKLKEAQAALDEKLPAVVLEDQSASRKESPAEVEHVVTRPDNTIVRLATILGAAKPLVRYMLSDRCTPADRQELRTLLGEESMFDLSNDFNALCGERARSRR